MTEVQPDLIRRGIKIAAPSGYCLPVLMLTTFFLGGGDGSGLSGGLGTPRTLQLSASVDF